MSQIKLNLLCVCSYLCVLRY